MNLIKLLADLEKSEHKNASSTELNSNKGAVPKIERLTGKQGILLDRQTITMTGKA